MERPNTTPQDRADTDPKAPTPDPALSGWPAALTNQRGWLRISFVAVAAWLLITMIVAADARWRWWSSYSGTREAFWFFAVGAGLIFAMVNAVPWIAQAFFGNGDKLDNRQVKNDNAVNRPKQRKGMPPF